MLWEGDPLSGWVATVTDNVGGRLLLRYDTPDCSGQTFWLFYQHLRLRPPDWLHLQEFPHRSVTPYHLLPCRMCWMVLEHHSSYLFIIFQVIKRVKEGFIYKYFTSVHSCCMIMIIYVFLL